MRLHPPYQGHHQQEVRIELDHILTSTLLFQSCMEEHQTMIIEEFEPDVFRQLIEYIHTGCVTLQPRTLLGVMNAADYYGLEELKHACSGFIQVSGACKDFSIADIPKEKDMNDMNVI